ncbi:MAG: ABC transporter substrate-binding protein, partial [Deltaproteobacteria bacterium]|nr:ABC transporter substrate-binding protein [Deltaproteobacteria bacterium]
MGRLLFIPLFVVLVLTGMQTEARAVDVIKIGNIEPFSGPSAPMGLLGRQARDMAVEEINSAGGIKSMGGAKIEMIYVDSKSDPTVGVTEAERLINVEKVHALMGCWNSAVSYPVTQR